MSDQNKWATHSTSTMDCGLRYNTQKRQWSLVDFAALTQMVQVLEFGARKYDVDNWRKGLSYRQCMESCLRHLIAFLEGEDIDPESGLNHLGHAMCNIMFLMSFENDPELKAKCDDRRKL